MIPARLIALFALTVSLPFSESKDAFPIHITKPDNNTIWHAGEPYCVEWAPIHHAMSKRAHERKGELYLAKKGKNLSHLSGSFNVSAGKVDIVAPMGINGVYEVALVSDFHTIAVSADFKIVSEGI